MNILMKLELEIEKNGILVLLVIVLVSNVLLVLGGFLRSILDGICVFKDMNFCGFFKNLIILINFCFFFFLLVIFEK